MSIEDPRLSSIDRISAADDFDAAVEQHLGYAGGMSEGIEVAQAETSEDTRTDRLPAQAQPVQTVAAAIPSQITPNAENVVTLPAGIELDNLTFEVAGQNLVLVLADGTEIVVVGGAANVPTFVIGDVELPQVALFAALEGSNINVAAGPDGTFTAQSAPASSRDFEDNQIGDGFEEFSFSDLLGDTGFGDEARSGETNGDDGEPTILSPLTQPFIYDEAVIADNIVGNQVFSGRLPFEPGPDFGTITAVNFTGATNVDEGDGGSTVLAGFTSGGRAITVTSFGPPSDGADLDFLAIEGRDSAGNLVFTLTINNRETGDFTFELVGKLDHPDAGSNGSQNGLSDLLRLGFTYTVTDLDGDFVTGSFNIDVQDDAPRFGVPETGSVDEDSLVGPIKEISPEERSEDFDRLVEAQRDGEDNRLVTSGRLNIVWGADNGNAVADSGATVTSANDRAVYFTQATINELLSQRLTSDGFNLRYELSDDGRTLFALKDEGGPEGGDEVARVLIFKVTLSDLENGSFEFELAGNLDHRVPGTSAKDEEDLPIEFNFTVRDSDGDAASSNFTVNVNDDSPERGEAESATAEDEAVNGGNNEPDDGSAIATGALDIRWGADDADSDLGGMGDRSVAFSNVANAGANITVSGAYGASLTSLGQAVSFGFVNGILVGYTGSTPPTALKDPSIVFHVSLSDDDSGSYTFTLVKPLDHSAGDGSNGENNISLTFSYTATDSDGDTVTGTFSVAVQDDIATIGTPFAGGIVEEEQEEVAGDGNEGTQGNGDADSWSGPFWNPRLNDQTTHVTGGTLAISWGSDNANGENGVPANRSVQFGPAAIANLAKLNLTSDGDIINYTIVRDADGQQVLLAYTGSVAPTAVPQTDSGAISANIVFQVALSDSGNGSYSFKLFNTLDHQKSVQGEDSQILNFQFTATDSDGDVTEPATFSVKVIDDVPMAQGAGPRYVEEEALARGNEDGSPLGVELTGVAANKGPITNTIGASLNIAWGGDDGNTRVNGGFTGTQIPGDRSVVFEGKPVDYLTVYSGNKVMDLSTLTSQGVSLVYTLSGNGTVLTAKAGENGPTVFTVTLSDANKGSYNFTLSGVLDHPVKGDNPSDEDVLSFNFTFTARDGDGDVVREGFQVNVIDDSPVIGRAERVTVEDEAVNNGNNENDGLSKSATGSLAISWGADNGNDNNGQPGDRSVAFTNARVEVSGDYGHDLTSLGMRVYTALVDGVLVAFTGGQNAAPSTFNANSLPANIVFYVTLSDASDTGSYTFNLVKPLDHAEGRGENDLSLTFNFTATDSDGDYARDTFTVNVRDDVAIITPPATVGVVEEEQDAVLGKGNEDTTANGESEADNVDADTEADSNITTNIARGSLGISWGSDDANDGNRQPGDRSVQFANSARSDLKALGLTSDGAELSYKIFTVQGQQILVAYTGSEPQTLPANPAQAGIVFTVALSDGDNGQYTFTLYNTLDHKGSVQGEDALTLNFKYTATDSDGDVTQPATFSVKVLDDVPAASTTGALYVEEEAFSRGNKDSEGSVESAASAANGGADQVGLKTGASLGIRWGGDDANRSIDGGFTGTQIAGDRSVVFATGSGSTSGLPHRVAADDVAKFLTVSGGNGAIAIEDLRSEGRALVFALSGDGTTLMARAGSVEGPTVFVVKLSDQNNGSYEFELKGVLDHPIKASGAANEDVLSLKFTFTARDGDGDVVRNDFTVNVIDDSPIITSPEVGKVEDEAVNGGNNETDGLSASVVDGSLGISWGADNANNGSGDKGDRAVFFTNANVQVSGGYTSSLTSLGQAVETTLINGVLVGYTGAAPASFSVNPVPTNVVFYASLSDTSTNGSYNFTLVKPLDHAAGNGENELTLTFNFTARDSDGDTASSTFQVKVVDDILTIGTPVGGIVEEEQREVSGRGNEDDEGTDDRDTAQNPDVTTHRTGGSLDINWGSDKANDANGQPGDRSVVFSTATVAVADAYGSTITSLGEAVKTAILSSGTLIGYTGNSVPSLISSDRVVFYATVSDADPKGSYSFTLVKPLDHKAGEGENQLTLTFRFTATDSDGDTADGSFTVKVIDDIPTVPTSVNAAYRLDDEGQDAIANGNPGGEPSDPWPSYSVVSGDEGTLFRAGADGVSSIAITGPAFQVVYENRQGFAETESVTWGSGRVASNGSVTFTATSTNYPSGAAVLVIRPDGSYSFELKAPVAHSGAGEDDKLLSFGYTVTDGDGDAKSGTLNITVNDDTPTAPSVVNAGWDLDDEAQWGVSSPNYFGPNDVTPSLDEVWGGRGTLFSAGSDGVKSITIEKSSFDVIFKNAQGFAEVVTVTWGAGTVGANGTVTFKATNATYFPNGAATLVIRTDGSYVLDLDAPIAHQTPGTREEDATLPIRYTVTDGDGDVKSGTLNIFVNDDTPKQDGDATTGRTLNEDDLVGGNDSLPREPLSTTGDLNVSFGSDGVRSFALSADNANWNDGTRTLTAGDNSWTISVAADGTYRFTLLDNTLAHGPADNGENTLDISVRYVVTDGDGDQISGNFGIRIVDDVPVATSAVLTGAANELLVADGNPATPEVKGVLSSLVSFGADGAHATNAYTVETRDLSTSLTSLTSNGIPLTFTAVGNVMTARAGEVPVFTFAVNAVTGEYTFTQLGPIDHIEKVIMDGQGYPLSVLSAANAQLKVPYVGGDDFAVVGRLPNGDVIIRVTNDGNSAVSWKLDNNSVTGDNLVINLAARQTVYVNVGNIAADPIVRFDVDGDNAPNGVVVINRGTPNIEFIDGRTSLTLDLSSAVTVRDGDGDTLALSNQLKITVTDSTPSAASNINGEVFEDGNKSIEGRALVNWNADNGPAKTLVLNGNPSILDARGNTVGTLYSNSQAVAFTTINGVLIAYIAGKDAAVAANQVFTLSLDAATGSYSFTLLQPLDHTEPNGNDHFLTLGFTAVATDGDSDVISVPFTVKVDAAGTIDGSSISYGNVSTGVFVNLNDTAADISLQQVAARMATDRTGSNVIGRDALGAAIANAEGGSGDDILVGNNVANILSGADGKDVLVGRDGNDILEGGKGNDILQGDEGDDTLRGGDGNDILSGGRGNDVLEGGAGDDTLIVSADIDDAAAFGPRSFTLGNGDVRSVSLARRSGEGDSLSGGTGIDTVTFTPASPDKGFVFDRANASLGLSGVEKFIGTDGDDIILLPKTYTTSDAAVIEINGGKGNDILQGSDAQADKITGGIGNDWISGLGGNDDLDGGDGNDEIWGGAGNDTISGGEGNDTLVGGAGNDVIEGGAGNDRILYTVGDGDDIVDGGTAHPDYDELVVSGDATARTFTLGLASGGTEIGDAASKDVLVSYDGGSVRADEIERVTFNLGSGGDAVILNSVTGSAIAPSTIVVNGGVGNDTIDLSNFVGSTVQIVDAGGTDTLKFSNVRWQAVTVTKDETGQFILNLPNGTVVKAGGIESFTFQNGTVSAQQLIQQAPSDIDTTGLTIAENSGEGASVGSVNGTDVNGEIDPLTYAFVTDNGTSQTSPDGRFTINATTGAITLAAGASIDYETEKTIDVTIRVTDSRLGYIDEKFTINVTDVNEAPTAVGLINIVSAIDENIVVGSEGIKVADITVTDDALGTNQLSLAGDDAASFRIVGNALYFVGTQVNYEAKASYSVSVQVNDTTVGGTPDASQTFTLNVNNLNDLSTSTNDSITILEDTATPLTINDFGTFKDEDAGQSLAAVKITALPSNGTLQFQGTSGWTNVSLDQEVSVNDIIAGKLQFVPALNANDADYATIGFKVGDGTDFSSEAYTLTVDVTPVNDAPTANAQTASGREDGSVSITLSGGDVDGTIFGYVITTLPANGDLFAGNGGSVLSRVVPGQIFQGATVVFIPNKDYSGPASFTYATVDDHGAQSAQPATVTINVTPVADRVLLDSYGSTGEEDANIPLKLAGQLTDLDGSETLTLTLSKVPVGATISDGTNTFVSTVQKTSVDITGWSIPNLVIKPPLNSHGYFELELTGTATEQANGDSNSNTISYAFWVTAVGDAPVLTVTPASGEEDKWISLQFSGALTDPSETLSYSISNLPEFSELSDGTRHFFMNSFSPTSVSLEGWDLSSLKIRPPSDFAGEIVLKLTATSTEGNGKSASVVVDLPVVVAADADTPSFGYTYYTLPRPEDTDLWFSVEGKASDRDGSETLKITISDIPVGAVLTDDGGNRFVAASGSTTADITAWNTRQLFLRPPLNMNGTINLTLSVTATESSNQDSETEIRAIPFVVGPANDAPVISVEAGDRAEAALTETNTGLTTSGTLTVTDVDGTDIVRATAQQVTASGPTGGLTTQQLLGFLSFANAQVLDPIEKTDKLTWNFNSGSQAFDFLAAGQTLTLNYVVRATDNSSGAAFDDQTVTITITGTNDGPVISGLDNVSIAENQTGVLIDTFQVSDVDTASGQTFRVLNAGGTEDSRFEVVPANSANAGKPGTYELRLKAGQSLDYETVKTVSLTVEVNDHVTGNNITSQPVTITVTDVVENRAPVANNDILAFGAPALGTGWTYNAANGHYYKIVAGNFAWDQAFAAANAQGAYLATITSQAEQTFIQQLATLGTNWYAAQSAWIGASDRSVEGNWTWVTGPEAGTQFWLGTSGGTSFGYQNWGSGEPNNWASNEDYAQILFVGGGIWNDSSGAAAPVGQTGDYSGYVAEWGSPSASGAVSEDVVTKFSTGLVLANDTDPDGNTLVVTGLGAGNTLTATTAYGATVTLNTLTGEISYNPTASATIQALPQGENLVDTFSYTISDGQGGTATATASITIRGVNDAPTITGLTSSSVSEDGTLVATGTLTIVDTDTGQSGAIAASGNASHGTWSITAGGTWTYTLDNSKPAVQNLNTGQTLSDSFTVTTADGTQQVINITINGLNEVPLTVADTSSATGRYAFSSDSSALKTINFDASTLFQGGTGPVSYSYQLVYSTDETSWITRSGNVFGGNPNNTHQGIYIYKATATDSLMTASAYFALSVLEEQGVTLQIKNDFSGADTWSPGWIANQSGNGFGDLIVANTSNPNNEANANSGDDTMLGEGGVNRFDGGDDDDAIYGFAGNDVLKGGSGQDFIDGGTGNDTITGGSGDDVLVGGSGNDTFMYAIGDGADIMDGGRDSDTLSIVGSGGNETLNVVVANGAVTQLNGGTVTNIETVNANMGSGTDTLTYAGTLQSVTVSLANSTASGFSSISNIENVTGGSGSDTLIGNDGANTLVGGAGNDTLTGGAGSDRLSGEGGNDTLYGDQSDAVISGGDGTDTLIIDRDFSSLNDAQLVSVEKIDMIGGARSLNLSSQTEGFSINIFADADGNSKSYDVTFRANNGRSDEIIFEHNNVGNLHNTAVTVTNFETGNDKVRIVLDGQSSTSEFRQVSGANENLQSLLNNGVIEILDNRTTASLTSDGQGGAVHALIAGAIGSIGAGQYTVIVYSGTSGTVNAGIYSLLVDSGGNLNVSNSEIEHVMTINNVGYGGLKAENFAGVTDPIILDLDKNGFDLSSIGAGVRFDINADGHKDQMGWTSKDGILAYDVDGNGTVDNGSEIFTPDFNDGKFASGVAALASLDSNGDGKIDANDDAFSKLQIWIDANNNGVSDAGELSSLADHRVASISLTTDQSGGLEDDQTIFAAGEFTFDDGSTGNFVEVGFDTIFGSDVSEGLTLHGGMGEVVMTGSAGADTFVFDGTALDDLDVADVITDFHSDEGDVLDVTALLDSLLGEQASADTAASHLRATVEDGNTTVSVQTAPDIWKDVVVLQNHDTAIKVLFDDKHAVVTPHD